MPARRRGCPAVRGDRYLLAPTHNGFGNQLLGVEKALWLAVALNRTLIVPPLLRHGEFERWPPCAPAGVAAAGAAAAAAYRGAAAARPATSRFGALFDLRSLAAAGALAVDFAASPLRNASSAEPVRVANASCARTAGLGAAALRAKFERDAQVVEVGSALRMDLAALRADLRRAPCGRLVVRRASVVPFARPVVAAGAAVAAAAFGAGAEYDAAHLRTGDRASNASDGFARAAARAAAETSRASGRPLYVAADLARSFDVFARGARCVTGGGCACLRTAANATAAASAAVAAVRAAHGGAGDAALDLEVASGAAALVDLARGAPTSFRKLSTFFVHMRRRHARRQKRGGGP